MDLSSMFKQSLNYNNSTLANLMDKQCDYIYIQSNVGQY